MTRFDASDPSERRALFADAIRAHRERASPYLTVEVAPGGSESDAEDPLPGSPDPTEIDDSPEQSAESPPWIQLSTETLNLDCADEELERLKSLLADYPAFRIEELTSPENAEGTNVRVTARADANRLAGFLERTFREVYGRPEEYRVWVAEI